MQYLFTSREVHAYAIDLAGSTAVLTGSFDCVDAPTPVMQYIGVNMAHPLLSDSAVRRALSAAIDRETIASGYLSGHGSAADFPIAPQSSLYPHGFSKPYSPEESAAALRGALAGVEERQTLRLLVNEEGGEKVAIAQFIAQALSQGDLEVIVTALPWAEYMAALEAGDFDLYYGEVKLTADWDITPLVGTGGALNYGGLCAGWFPLLQVPGGRCLRLLHRLCPGESHPPCGLRQCVSPDPPGHRVGGVAYRGHYLLEFLRLGHPSAASGGEQRLTAKNGNLFPCLASIEGK